MKATAKSLLSVMLVAVLGCPARRVEVYGGAEQQNVWRIVDAACRPTASGQVECDGAALGDGLRAVALLERDRDGCRSDLQLCDAARRVECGLAAGELADCQEKADSLIRSPWMWGGASLVVGFLAGLAVAK